MIRLKIALAFAFVVTACVTSEPAESPERADAATGGAGGAPPNGDGSGGQQPVDGGAGSDAGEEACLADGSLFGTGVCDSGTSATDAASDPCFQAIAWVSETVLEPHLMPGETVTLDGILYQFTGTEQQWALADCAPNAPVSWCPDSGWTWQQVGTC